MLRVGLTGGLGSGKSTVASIFAGLGAHVLSSDAIGRDLMQPGETVYAAIADHFGPEVLLPDGFLDRAALADIAFAEGRVEELNAIVHPAVIARQAELSRQIAHNEPHAVILVESALIFETNYSENSHGNPENRSHAPALSWRSRFDRIILVTASEELKIARFIDRIAEGNTLSPDRREALEAEAHRRLARQLSDDRKAALADYILTNNGSLQELEWQIDQLWPILHAAARVTH